jgi:hypothetical protein
MNQEKEFFTASTIVVGEVVATPQTENKRNESSSHPEVYYG